jgi:aminoglycoside phosphotransferase
MGQFSLAELPSALAEHVPARARLTYPAQGKTSDVAFAEHDGRVVVVKRCAHPVYLEWLRREQVALRALEHTGLSVPRFIAYTEAEWVSRQLAQARANLPWCDGTAVGLAELERSRPTPVAETLVHGDLALDNVLVDANGSLSLIDWADGGPGDPRHDVALALQTKPELELSTGAIDAFAAGYGAAVPAAATRNWFVRLYDYF